VKCSGGQWTTLLTLNGNEVLGGGVVRVISMSSGTETRKEAANSEISH
jgi:hypothetical protein